MKLRDRGRLLRPRGILLVVLVILFTICAGPASAASEQGTVTIVLPAEPRSLDPGESVLSDEGKVMVKNILEPLTEISPVDSTITPRLALSWKQLDGNTWQFALRKGVKFHDGADFNADAVIFNIKRLYDKRIDTRVKVKYFSNFTIEPKAVDSHTVTLRTDKVEPLLPALLATLSICSPNTPSDKLVRNPVGTGPYKFVRWDAGTQIVLERFDGYWGKQPQVKKAIYLWRNESAVRASMVLIGEADLTPDIAKQDATQPDMDHSYLNSETTHLIIGAWEPPLTDRRVRLALNYAVDRNSIRGSILSKDVVPAAQLVGPTISGYNPDLKPWPYDPAKAKQLLAEARKDGVPVDREISLIGRTGRYSGSGEVMEALLTMYKAVGFNVKLKMVESAAAAVYQRKPYPPGPYVTDNSHDNRMGDAVFTVFNRYHSDGLQSHISDKKLDGLIEKAQVATGEERRNLWRAVFKSIHEDIVCDVFLYHMVGYCRVGKRINFKPSIATNGEIELAQITFK
jgi:peptide/nickel transport system substrate-binding protein